METPLFAGAIIFGAGCLGTFVAVQSAINLEPAGPGFRRGTIACLGIGILLLILGAVQS